MSKVESYADEYGVIPFINEMEEELVTESTRADDDDCEEEKQYPKAKFRVEGAFFISDSLRKVVTVYTYTAFAFINLDAFEMALKAIDPEYDIRIVLSRDFCDPRSFLFSGSIVEFVRTNERVSVSVPYCGNTFSFLLYAAAHNRDVDNFTSFTLCFNPDEWDRDPFREYRDTIVDFYLQQGLISDAEAEDLKKGKFLSIPNGRVKSYASGE